MNLKILFAFLVYYSLLSIFFLAVTGSETSHDYNVTIDLNATDMRAPEIDTGGLFGTGVSFGRFIGFVGFGVGMPNDTPTWFSYLWVTWQTIVTIMFIGFIIASIWNG